jgi:hypothetical protein
MAGEEGAAGLTDESPSSAADVEESEASAESSTTAPPSPSPSKHAPEKVALNGKNSQLGYAGVLPGVSLAYEVLPGGVKETLVLADATAPTRFRLKLNGRVGTFSSATGGGRNLAIDSAENVSLKAASATFLGQIKELDARRDPHGVEAPALWSLRVRLASATDREDIWTRMRSMSSWSVVRVVPDVGDVARSRSLTTSTALVAR